LARQERAERTRSTILDAAAAVIDERGFNGASLSDILAKAGVTKGALYFHFSSKEEVAQALINEQFSAQEPFADTGPGGIQTIIDMSHEMAHNLRTNVRVRASMRLVVESNFEDPMPEPYLAWISLLKGYLEIAQARGDLRKELVPEDVANWVSGSFLGVWTQSQVLTGRADIHQRLTDMWTIALPGLVPPRRLSRFIPSGTAQYDTAGTAATA
jgi:AcrR family transcriptional regulator